MQRRATGRFRFCAWLCILFLFISLFAPAFAQSTTGDSNTYNPEDLSEDQLKASSAILIEANSGEVIFEKNADTLMYPASTTKIMTVFLGLTIGKTNNLLDEVVTVSGDAVNIPEDSSVIPLSAGETIRFEDLLYATMIKSGNEGANEIAETISGSVPAFVDLMNQTAQMMGCTSTHFANPHGLHDDNHYTTARDMAIIAKTAMNDSAFRQIAASTSYGLPRSNMQKARTVSNTKNLFMVQSESNSFYYPYANGIKTGFTDNAGYCYVGSSSREGVSLISVVFHSSNEGQWTDTKKLMEYGFTQYVSVSPVELYDMNPIELETSGFSLNDPNMGRLPLELVPMDTTATAAIVVTKAQMNSLARNLQQLVIVEYIRDFAAPITAGEQMGTLTYFPPDGSSVPVEYALIASRSIEKRENAPKSIEEITTQTYDDPNPFPRFSLEFVVMAILPAAALFFAIRLLRRVFKKFGGRGMDLPKRTNRHYR